MLVISRKIGESIKIGNNGVVKLKEIKNKKAIIELYLPEDNLIGQFDMLLNDSRAFMNGLIKINTINNKKVSFALDFHKDLKIFREELINL